MLLLFKFGPNMSDLDLYTNRNNFKNMFLLNNLYLPNNSLPFDKYTDLTKLFRLLQKQKFT